MRPTHFRRRSTNATVTPVGGFGRSSGGRRSTTGAEDIVEQPVPTNPGRPQTDQTLAEYAVSLVDDAVKEAFPKERIETLTRAEIAREIESMVAAECSGKGVTLDPSDLRDVVTVLINNALDAAATTPRTSGSGPEESASGEEAGGSDHTDRERSSKGGDKKGGDKKDGDKKDTVEAAKSRIQPLLLEQIDVGKASELGREELAEQVGEIVGELLVQQRISLNLREQRDLVTKLLNDMLGLGPLEPLLADDEINDIMVNGPNQVYVERKGKLELTNIKFRDERHLMNVCTRIVSQVGRRVDESSPVCDARLADGSRVNIIIPPLAIDGASISIRKFAKTGITLDLMAKQGNISQNISTILRIASACRLNILISGGTGSGKTTMLNALSQMVDHGERIVTIEDAAELQLQQPHVVRLETRPPNLEGDGEITMRDLVKNALRMRPDRIILGEIRSAEAIDMLQAMNTGHDGSMCTIHANTPRDCLMRLENMVGMVGVNLPSKAVRTQITAAIDVIIQVSRMRDGVRRVQYVTEVVGMEGDVITTQDLFRYRFTGEDANGRLTGSYESTGVRPHFTPRAEYYGLERALMEAVE